MSGRFLIQVWARAVNIMKKQMNIPFRIVSFLPLRWQETRTAVKTTLFNQLTGSSQHVGNFPGVTVDRKDGIIRGKKNTLVTDLPGIYSMSPYTSEEIVTRSFILEQHPKGIIKYCGCNQY